MTKVGSTDSGHLNIERQLGRRVTGREEKAKRKSTRIIHSNEIVDLERKNGGRGEF